MREELPEIKDISQDDWDRMIDEGLKKNPKGSWRHEHLLEMKKNLKDYRAK